MAIFNTVTRTGLAPLALAALAIAYGCVEPPVYLPPGQAGNPQGVLSGTVTYSGPLPCTEDDHIVGAALMLVFDVNLLPPPEGLGTTAASLAVVPGDELFSGVRDKLVFDGKNRWCPDPADTTVVTVSATWNASPLAAGTYQVRGFYDRDGNFDPVFSITNLPTRGDVGGGAIENAAEVLQGKAPVYRAVTLGAPDKDGKLQIPEEGAVVDGIAVTLGLTLPLDRPIFYSKDVTDNFEGNKDPKNVTMPSDYQLDNFNPGNIPATENSLLVVGLGAGVPAGEVQAAAAAPFGLPVAGSPKFTVSWQDVNKDGVLDEKDTVPASNLVPSLFPISVFAKLTEESDIVAQSAPAIVLQGITLYKSLPDTVDVLANPGNQLPDQVDEVFVALPPAVLCLDPLDVTKNGVLLVSHETDTKGNPLLPNQAATLLALKKQFGRQIDLKVGCLPEGRYSMNLVYETGQAWTVPNEGYVCAPAETPVNELTCGDPARARLASQGVALTIGAPNEAQYCKDHPTPAECLPAPKKSE